MIDLDITVDGSWLKHYRRMVQRVLESYGLKATALRITPSRSRGCHVRIYLNRTVQAETTIMLQWLLLDDHGRVDFNRARIDVGFDEWNKLFELPRR
jgi:hypothetical protein